MKVTAVLRTGFVLPAILIAILPVPAGAQERNAASTLGAGNSAAERYAYGIDFLKRGRSFERATAHLEEAVRQESKSQQYRLALGCAYASRAASLADAASRLSWFSEAQAGYPQRLAAWEAAQKDENDPLYGKPRPQLPSFRTRDDNQPFTLTLPEAMTQIRSLGKQAIAEWDRALELATTKSERAEAHYVRGWGVRLLRSRGWIGYDSQPLDIEGLPEAEEVTKAFLAATEEDPADARCWQSLGDAHIGESANARGARDKPAALAAYRQALSLQKRNATLWYRLYDLQRTDDPEQAKEALRQAALSDPGNAYPLYRLAGLLFYETPYSLFHKELQEAVRLRRLNGYRPPTYAETGKRVLAASSKESEKTAQEAVASIERGNKAPRYVAPLYQAPVPALLKGAWNLRVLMGASSDTSNPTIWHTVSLSASGYARVAAGQRNEREALRAARAVVAMGYKIMGNLGNKALPLGVNDLGMFNSGGFIVLTGYEALADVYKALGETAAAERVTSERGTFNKGFSDHLRANQKARQYSYGGN